MRRDTSRLALQTFDLIVVGGGVHGAAIAWEAARRGVRVGLLEARDYGCGSSGSWLRVAHGGLRPFLRGDLLAAVEAERALDRLLRVAPQFVTRSEFVLTDGVAPQGVLPFARIGFRTFDAFRRVIGGSATARLPGARRADASELAALLPCLRPSARRRPALVWSEATVDDSAALLVSLLGQVEASGGCIANDVSVVDLISDRGRVCGVRGHDHVAGRMFEIRTRAVVLAAGAGNRKLLPGAAGSAIPEMVPAWNIVLPSLGMRAAVALRGRDGDPHCRGLLFARPWGDRTVVGTAYGRCLEDREGAIHGLLDALGDALRVARPRRADVLWVQHGWVPLRRGGTELAVRDECVGFAKSRGLSGLWCVTGAKFVSAFAAAERAARRIVAELGGGFVAPGVPASIPVGAARDEAARFREAATGEAARHLDDVLFRRLEVGALGFPGMDRLQDYAATMATIRDWDAERRRREVARVVAVYRAAGVATSRDGAVGAVVG